MDGAWFQLGCNSIYGSKTRSMARFGLLIYSKGEWEGNAIVNESYLHKATNTSTNINLGYGDIWWLNGKPSYY